MRRPFKPLLIAALPIAIFTLALGLTTLDARRNGAKKQREEQRESDRWKTMVSGRAICFKILGYQQISILGHDQISSRIALTNFEDCLRDTLITLDEYMFLTNHGAIFHTSAWNSSDSNAVVMELLDGDYLISRNGAGWKKGWSRFLQEASKR